MYVKNQNIPAVLKIDFEKIFSKSYPTKYYRVHYPGTRRVDVRVTSTHIYVWHSKKWAGP